MFNPRRMMELKNMKDGFEQRHPKVPLFLKAVSEAGISENSVIEISIKNPDGRDFCSNIKVTPEDLEMLEHIKELKR